MKEGGAYVKTTGRFVKADRRERVIVLEDGRKIRLDDIANLWRG